MPNWCDNYVEISGKDKASIDRVVTAFEAGTLCAEFVPIPEALRDTTSPNRDEASAEKLIEETGYSDWYSFCVNEWGTKWDVGSEDRSCDGVGRDSDTYVTLSFQSAWSPPIGLYEKLEELGYSVRAYYYEPGMAYAGIFENGFCEDYSLEGTSEEVKEEIPESLDEMFGITETMAEYEEMERESE